MTDWRCCDNPKCENKAPLDGLSIEFGRVDAERYIRVECPGRGQMHFCSNNCMTEYYGSGAQ